MAINFSYLQSNPYATTGGQAPSANSSYTNSGLNAQTVQDPTAVLGANTTASTATYDPQTQQAIANVQSAIDRTGQQLNAGNASLDNQYNIALQQLLLGKNQGQQAYNQSSQTNATNFVGNKNTIGSQAGASLNSLLRLLGSRGASGSATDVARQAVDRGATLQRADATQNFGTNQQGLDTNWNNYLTGYNNSVTGVGAQRDQGKQSLQQSIDSNKAQLLQTLAGLQTSSSAAQPYLDQANGLLNADANVTIPQINYQTQAYTPQSLVSYTTPQTSANLSNNNSGGDYFSPYLSALLGKKQATA